MLFAANFDCNAAMQREQGKQERMAEISILGKVIIKPGKFESWKKTKIIWKLMKPSQEDHNIKSTQEFV